jgi:amino acid adenylation domain-containing protein
MKQRRENTGMSDFTAPPPKQEAIQNACFHRTGSFVQFLKGEVEHSIPHRFEKIVQLYPNRRAIKTFDHTLTYTELNMTANRLARAIQNQQGSKTDPVALLFEKGVPLMAAMLAVLKAGKPFVLLDPSLPRARIAAIYEDSQARLIVTDRQNTPLATDVKGSGCRLMDFDLMDCRGCADNLELVISPATLAFIVYTSGSTGEPKGVAWQHRTLLHHVMLYTNAYRLNQEDRISLLASGTTAAVAISFHSLLNGATLLPFDVQKEGLIALANWLARERISFCLMSSPLFRSFVATLAGQEQFPDLRLIQLISETAFRTDVDLYKKYFSPDCLLSCGLSSSETGLIRSCLMNHDTEVSGNEAPLGYAVEDKEVMLLDESGNEVGFNEVGEIVVRSRYLSPGYWRRPDLTEAKFKPDPQGGDRRLYFTADLGLMLPGGCLVYKGRKDSRVKVRGYGVEIGEIEMALLNHPDIREAIVVARQNELGESRLVAYFTSIDPRELNASDLRTFLKEKLPDYMIPSDFVILDRIPLGPGGKVDRKALAAPDNSRPQLASAYIAPKTPIEVQLAKIWSDLLDIDRVGINDNFFDLGGHSLTASRVISRVIQTFRLNLPLKLLFDSPTVAEMASVIAANQAKLATQDELKRMLSNVEAMSDEEAQRRMDESSSRVSKK